MKALAALALCASACTMTGPPIPDGGVVRQSGEVTVWQNAGHSGGSLSARFQIDRCGTTVIGNCTVVDCRNVDMGAPETRSAGTISISITGKSAPLTLIPGNDGTYPTEMLSGQLWKGGETIAVSAPGSAVPGFNNSLKAPANLAGIVPAGGPLTINRSRDYNVTWGTPIADPVHALLSLDIGVSVECVWPGGDLTDAIPSFALELLGPGDGTWSLFSGPVVVQAAGGFVVSTVAAQEGSDTLGNPQEGGLTIN
jgi:hypothetical protein